MWKPSSRRKDQQFSKFFHCWRQFCGPVSKKNRLLVLRNKLTPEFLWQLKHLLDSSFSVFKNLLSHFWSVYNCLPQFFSHKIAIVWTYIFYFFGACLSRADTAVSLNFDSGAFLISNFNNSFLRSCRKVPFSKFL